MKSEQILVCSDQNMTFYFLSYFLDGSTNAKSGECVTDRKSSRCEVQVFLLRLGVYTCCDTQ